jgi:hypothetical protein
MNEYRATIAGFTSPGDNSIAVVLVGNETLGHIFLQIEDDSLSALSEASVGDTITFTVTGNASTVIRQSEDNGSTWSIEAPAKDVRVANPLSPDVRS